MCIRDSPNAENILPRLKRLKENGIRFHCQIVCCPGWNDGEVLRQTLDDLAALAPAAQTVAVVPVGLTAYRDGLEPLTLFNRETAGELLDQLEPDVYKRQQLAFSRLSSLRR